LPGVALPLACLDRRNAVSAMLAENSGEALHPQHCTPLGLDPTMRRPRGCHDRPIHPDGAMMASVIREAVGLAPRVVRARRGVHHVLPVVARPPAPLECHPPRPVRGLRGAVPPLGPVA